MTHKTLSVLRAEHGVLLVDRASPRSRGAENPSAARRRTSTWSRRSSSICATIRASSTIRRRRGCSSPR